MAIELDQTSFKDKVDNAKGLVLVDFWAEWCPPCRALAPILHQLEEEMADKVTVAKVDVDSNQDLAIEHQVQGIPTVKLFKDGKEIKTWVGLVPKATYIQAIEDNL